MDVQAAAATLPLPAHSTITLPGSTVTGAGSPSAVATVAGTPAPVSTGSGSGSSTTTSDDASKTSNSAIGPTPGLATLPAGAAPGQAKVSSEPSLSANVAKLYNTAESNVSVSYEVEKDPNEIVTVFTDKTTGKVIVQFPSETLVALAQFFDKLDGTVVNKKV